MPSKRPLEWRFAVAIALSLIVLLLVESDAQAGRRSGYAPSTRSYSHRTPSHTPRTRSYTHRTPSYTHRAPSHTPRTRSYTHRTPSYTHRTRGYTGGERALPGVPRDSHGDIKRSETAKREFMKSTGYPNGRPGYVIDHVIPLARGGADSPSNMQWQTIGEARAKDKWELGQHTKVRTPGR
jgi:hypothetical protein